MRINQLIPYILYSVMSLANASVDQHLEQIRNNTDALYKFFQEMPKGGELHYHLAGGASPEAMLELAPIGGYCMNKVTHALSKAKPHCDGIPLNNLRKKSSLYKEILHAWSLQDFKDDKESNHDHFFASFFKFQPLVADYSPQLLSTVMEHAANQNELYIEVMVLPDNAYSTSFGKLIKNAKTFDDKQKILLENNDFQKNIAFTVSESNRYLVDARKFANCDESPDLPKCKVAIKFQYIILREQPLDNMFAQTLNAFASASISPELVSINLVQAEDGPISLRDYRKQMQVIKHIHRAYPNVHITLHAGELSKNKISEKSIAPKELSFHIHDALFIGESERIGHGIDIPYEQEVDHILKHMSETPVPVEINLTSNKKLLKISGQQHPLHYYLSHEVPVVLSTDDEGILRTDITEQYVEAFKNQKLDYKTIKNINRNTLTYAFISGVSIWLNPNKDIIVKQCENLESQACLDFVKGNDKATLQRKLEKKLNEFETKFY